MASVSLRRAAFCKEDAGPRAMAYITPSSVWEGLKVVMNHQDLGFGHLPPLKIAFRQDNGPAEIGGEMIQRLHMAIAVTKIIMVFPL